MLKPSCKAGRTGFKPGSRTGTNESFNPVSNQPALKNDVRGNDDSCSAAPKLQLSNHLKERFKKIYELRAFIPVVELPVKGAKVVRLKAG